MTSPVSAPFRAVSRRKHPNFSGDMTGRKYGDLVVVGKTQSEDDSWDCTCSCGKTVSIWRKRLLIGAHSSCGCKSGDKKVEQGMHFGKLTVVGSSAWYTDYGKEMWACKCACGTEIDVPGRLLRKGAKRTCGCNARATLEGRRYGHLRVLEYAGRVRKPGEHPRSNWKCECVCGGEAYATTEELRKGLKTSCKVCSDYLAYALGEDDLGRFIVGQRFGNLIISHVPSPSENKDYLGAVCDCGSRFKIPIDDLANGATSCGCKVSDEIFVYGIQSHTYVKIGTTNNIFTRLDAIQTGSPFDLKILCVLGHGSVKKEKQIHRALNRYHTFGEWFTLEDDLRACLSEATDTDDLLARIKGEL